MKLSEYIIALCNALESVSPEGKPATMQLLAEHKAYRDIAAKALRGVLLNGSTFMLDMLFHEKEEYANLYRGSFKAAGACAMDKEAKPKRAIQKLPKRGNIPKAKIEKAVKEVKDAAKER